jgi:hypothetical protein
MAFFKALGWTFNPQFTDETAASLVISEDIHAMLLSHEKLAGFNSCEDRVLALDALQRKGENALKGSSRSMYGLAALLFLVGIVFPANLRTDEDGLKTFDILLTAVFSCDGKESQC